MRCPNQDCREIFSVTEAPAVLPVPSPRPPSIDFELTPLDELGPPTRIAPVAATERPALPPEPFKIPSSSELPYEWIEGDSVVMIGKLEAPMPSGFSGPVPGGETVVYTRSSSVSDPLPPAKPGPAPTAKPLPLTHTAKPLPPPVAKSVPPAPKPLPPKPRASVPVAERSPRAPALPPGLKEVSWTDDAPPPPTGEASSFDKSAPAVEPPKVLEAEPVEPVQMLVRRRRRSPWRGVFLTVLIIGTVVALVGIAVGYLQHTTTVERREADEAKEAYEKGTFASAATKFDNLAKESPDGSDSERYRFFAALSATRATIDAVSLREKPGPGAKQLSEFLAKFGNSPLAQPGSGFGADIVQTGRKLADALADHAGDRVKAYRLVSTNPEKYKPADVSTLELDTGEAALSEGRAILPGLDRFREKDTPGFGDQRKKFDDISAEIAKERDRLATLEPYRSLPVDPTDDRIDAGEVALRSAGLGDDPQVKAILLAAKTKLLELIKYTAGVVDARKSPGEAAAPVLFASPVAGSPEPRSPTDASPDVVFAVARGVLYALDTHTGSLLWGTRVAAVTADLRTADVPVRVDAGDGSEWVLVPSDLGGKPGLTARHARTGEPVWHQPLEAGFAGRPAVVGRRAYIPLTDSLGTVVEVQLATGRRLGHIQIRQPIGAAPVAASGVRVGTGFLYIPADARRVFVFEVGREAENGDREPPRLARIIGTGHPRDSLRGEPILVSNSDAPGAKFLILPQADGPTAMKLRCYTLPPTAEMVANPIGQTIPDAIPNEKPAEVSVPGWSWFPPVTDGERVVVATDSGAFAVFGVNQSGNLDRPLFAMPGPKPVAEAGDTVNRAVVVSADEDSAWAVLGGNLVRLRTAVDAAGGMRYVRHGDPRPVGEPMHRAQVRPAASLGVVVVRSGPTSAARAVAFDVQTGQLRWNVQLGAVPAASPLAFPSGATTIIDTEGGVYTIPPDGTGRGSVVAKPVADPAAKARIVRAADGATAWVLVPEVQKDGRKLRIRKVENGTLQSETTTPLADLPAGMPIASEGGILLPLTDGYVHRLAEDGTLKRGPVWRSAGAKPDAACFLTAFSHFDFSATDGSTRATRWRWPATGNPQKIAGPWETRTPISVPPAVFRDQKAWRIAFAETGGGVVLFDADKTDDSLMRWRSAKDNTVPTGSPGVAITPVEFGQRNLLVYAVGGRRLVALDADHPNPAWMTWVSPDDGPELIGWHSRGTKLITTDQTGRVTVVSSDKGSILASASVPSEGAFVTVPAEITGERAIVGLADGTAIVMPLK